jgi:hypothetical protein
MVSGRLTQNAILGREQLPSLVSKPELYDTSSPAPDPRHARESTPIWQLSHYVHTDFAGQQFDPCRTTVNLTVIWRQRRYWADTENPEVLELVSEISYYTFRPDMSHEG